MEFLELKFPQQIDCYQFQAGGKNLLLDIPSMGFLEIEELAGHLLKQTPELTGTQLVELLSTRYSEEDIKNVMAELALLKENYILLSREEREEIEEKPFVGDEGLSCLAMMLTGDSASKGFDIYGEFNCNGVNTSAMSGATAQKALEFFVENSGPRRYLTVIFCGKNPLLNFEDS